MSSARVTESKLSFGAACKGEYNLTVDRNGQIDIPKVGVVHVSSLTYRQLREVLDREFARQYTNFQMNVTLDNLRTIQIYVVGQARFPGKLCGLLPFHPGQRLICRRRPQQVRLPAQYSGPAGQARRW